jgi:NAD(P)-dependent dehydrogenase (short-subunit alcohol dehydrogenase family)
VLIGDIDEAALARARSALSSPRLRAAALDVTRRESVEAAVGLARREFGGLDTLVNCAILAVNLKGVYLCCKAAAPVLSESGRGRIVNLSSDAGKKGFPLISAYCASKFAVIGFSKAIAGELAPCGVTVNCVCPTGVTATGMGQQILRWLSEESGRPAGEILAAREQSVPVGRMGDVADVVNAVMFFLSDASGFITGETLNVDGGVLGAGVVPGLACRNRR